MNLQAFIQEKLDKFQKHYSSESNEYMAQYWDTSKVEIKNFLEQSLRQLATLTLEAVRLEEKEGIGADSVNFPSGKITTNDMRLGYNVALQDQATKAREFLGEIKI